MNFFRRLKIRPEEPKQVLDWEPQEEPSTTMTTKKPAKAKKAKKLKITVRREKALYDAPEENYFWVNNGLVLKNLFELKDQLLQMSDEQFDYHTKREGNDFAAWIQGVFGEKGLAKQVTKAKDRQEAAKALEKYLS